MNIRQASIQDIDRIMHILSEARESIARLGIDQWQYGYPTRDIIIDDVKKGRSFVVEDENGEVSATFALIYDGEVTYNKIYAGNWLLPESNYLALHRIALSLSKRGSGYADAIIDFIVKEAVAGGYMSVRVDTHNGNIPMRKMLERCGFKYCGVIHLIDGQPRVAYERPLE